jgi:hypothetical protein
MFFSASPMHSARSRASDPAEVIIGRSSAKRKSSTLKSSHAMEASRTFPVHHALLRTVGAPTGRFAKRLFPLSTTLSFTPAGSTRSD